MIWKNLSKSESKLIVDQAIEDGKALTGIIDVEYKELKDMINAAFDKALEIVNINKEELSNTNNKYKFDCYFGRELFKIFNIEKYKIREREASNDDLWRYIQVKIVPEIINYRWKGNITPRIYAQSNRLYLKTLWWYYYLSYNTSIDHTCELLLYPSNTTDTIVALVERSGKKGYRVDLYREIMKQKSENALDIDEFRKLMVLNSAKIKNINPSLTTNGVEGYVKELVSLCKGE